MHRLNTCTAPTIPALLEYQEKKSGEREEEEGKRMRMNNERV